MIIIEKFLVIDVRINLKVEWESRHFEQRQAFFIHFFYHLAAISSHYEMRSECVVQWHVHKLLLFTLPSNDLEEIERVKNFHIFFAINFVI